MSKNHSVNLLWDDARLVIAPSDRRIESLLRVKEKSIQQKQVEGKGYTEAKQVQRTVKVFEVVSETKGQRVIETYQGFKDMIVEHCRNEGQEVLLHDRRIEFPLPRLDLMHGFRFSQREILTLALIQNQSGLIGAPTRYGKCLGPGTEVLMADGSIKIVEDIRNGDLVMGQDSQPRKVVGCVAGQDTLYRVTPNKGEPFVVTQDHKLLLYRTVQGSSKKSPNIDGKEFLVTPAEYEKSSKTFKHLHKLVKRAVDFPAQDVKIDPYCYGLWIGDGHTAYACLTNCDVPCVKAWLLEARRLRLKWRSVKMENNRARSYPVYKYNKHERKGRNSLDKRNPLQDLVNESTCNGQGHKRLSKQYLVNSREIRLQLLAGIIDSDGYTNENKMYGIIGKHEKLMRDVQFLARSLGFRASLYPKNRKSQTGKNGVYYEVNISGNVSEIPVRLHRKKITGLVGRVNPLVTGFKVENIGAGQYYGFELEGPDGLFLLGDFTVTHNTTLLINTIRAFPSLPTVVTVPGELLVTQLYEDVKAAFPHRKVVLLGAGSKCRFPSDDITVCSMDSLDKCDHGFTRLLLVDESHAVVTDSRLPELLKFQNARKIGFGATLEGRYDGRDKLIVGALGPVLAQRTYLEGVAEGAIAPLMVYFLKVPVGPPPYTKRLYAYRHILYRNPAMAALIARICREVFPPAWQGIIFIKEEPQADLILEAIPEGSIAMAKKLTKKQRVVMMEKMVSDETKRAIATDILAQGVTFNFVRWVINAGSGGPYTGSIQKPGRLAEIRPDIPDKKYGVIVDFMFAAANELDPNPKGEWTGLIWESISRRKAYVEKGYEVIDVENFEQLKEHIHATHIRPYKQNQTQASS